MPIKIDPDAFYDARSVRALLGVTSHAIGKACRGGELQFNDLPGRRMFRGEWLIDWLEGRSRENMNREVRHAGT